MAAVLSAPVVSKPLGLRDRAVLEVFYSCGLRRNELIELACRDVDYARGTVFVRCGKGAKDRYVPIGERALFWLRLYNELVRPHFVTDRFPNHLFLSSVGTPLCPDWLSRSVRRYIALAGIEKRGSCHLLRHTVATLMLEGGADIRYVAEMLGHTRLETTQRYTRVSIDRLRTVHASAHPAAGLGVAMATELCAVLPQGDLASQWVEPDRSASPLRADHSRQVGWTSRLTEPVTPGSRSLELPVEELVRRARPLPPHEDMVIDDLDDDEGAAFLAVLEG